MINNYYLMKVELIGTTPLVWRTFYVPSNISLDRLHDVIQIIMGWNDVHLHSFKINDVLYTISPEEDNEGINEEAYRLNSMISIGGGYIEYIYDFGDKWAHRITLENNDYIYGSSGMVVHCIDGAMACPPEDVGGLSAYKKFCHAIKNYSNKNHDQMVEWYQAISKDTKLFEPNEFDLESINNKLLSFVWLTRDRALGWEEI
ncbi:MAG: plasmid pRiA4b ORF-3 family protein [Denitrovibrio sp.]|nr:MAG: plasmid pRiA4b ORF-3 family protein [Denitrovibrio sp.]